MPYFDAVPDPIEGFNRSMWAVNKGLFYGIVYPFSKGYNFVVPKPARKCVGNFGKNLAYPVRLVNSCLQGKWHGAWEETRRFGVNTTVGVAGLFDPATGWKIGRSDEDFGQTFGHYGNGPGFYLMFPLIGPSNGRDAVGKILDWPLDFCFWIGNANPDEIWPSAVRPTVIGNNICDAAPGFKRKLDSMADSYQAVRALYSLNRQRQVIDFVPPQGGNFSPDPTIGAVLFAAKTPGFVGHAVTRLVQVKATGKELPYSCWMQEKPAPLVFYIPGLGSHRLDGSTAAYADMMYRHGYSVVAISNPFQKEFMECASTMAVPGYGPADCDDVVNAIRLVLNDMRSWQGGKIMGTSLTGVSHGAYFTLMIAARETAGKLGDLKFDRYVAVNPPVKLAEALNHLDDMFNAPLAWPEAERRKRMEDAVYKALHFAQNGLDISGDIPLSREESQFLVGMAFRYILMGVIVNSQQRQNLGVLKNDPCKFVRQTAYREIRQISYAEYMDRFVLPYLSKTGRGTDRAVLLAATDLGQSTDYLQRNSKIRVQICEDDFLLTPADIAWFKSTFEDRLIAYPRGGHLGILHVPAVQENLAQQFSISE